MQTQDGVRFLKPTAQIWSDALAVLETTVRTPGKMAWLHLSQLIEFSNGEAVLAVMNDLGRTMIVNHMSTQVIEALSKVTGTPVRLKVIIDGTIKPQEYIPSLAALPSQPSRDAQPAYSSTAQSAHPSVAQPVHSSVAQPTFRQSGTNVSGTNPDRLPESKPQNVAGKAARSFFSPQMGRTDQQNSAGNAAARSPQISAQQLALAKPSLDSNLAAHHGLNQRYTFSTFVVGSNNRFCHSAAIAVSQRPGQTYNPLFIYGGVGLGKTHLMQAIAHHILSQSPNATVKYINCERFTNDMINSIRDGRMVDFRKRYRYLDVLLVDDIQFIEGKESTQEEFFHTFNALKESGKQIVISSDRPPKALSHLEERLRSRFEWGLISDIQAPDFETRLAILAKKCDLDGIKIDPSTLEHIASQFTNNIRELEGALIRVNAFASFTGERIDELALHNLLTPHGTPEQKPSLTIDGVINAVAKHYKVEPADLKSARRSQDLTLPRHIAMYLGYELMNLSFPRIGEAFGNRKHTSVLYAHSRIKEMIAGTPAVASSVATIKRALGH